MHFIICLIKWRLTRVGLVLDWKKILSFLRINHSSFYWIGRRKESAFGRIERTFRKGKGMRSVVLCCCQAAFLTESRTLLPVPIPVPLLLFQSWCGHAGLSSSSFRGCPAFKTFCSWALLSHCSVVPHFHAQSFLCSCSFLFLLLGNLQILESPGFLVIAMELFLYRSFSAGIFCKKTLCQVSFVLAFLFILKQSWTIFYYNGW